MFCCRWLSLHQTRRSISWAGKRLQFWRLSRRWLLSCCSASSAAILATFLALTSRRRQPAENCKLQTNEWFSTICITTFFSAFYYCNFLFSALFTMAPGMKLTASRIFWEKFWSQRRNFNWKEASKPAEAGLLRINLHWRLGSKCRTNSSKSRTLKWVYWFRFDGLDLIRLDGLALI